MASEPSDRVRDLLPETYAGIDDVMEHRIQQAPPFAKEPFPDFVWHVVGGKVTEALHDALDLNVFGLFARAWAKGAEIRRVAKDTLVKRDVPVVLCLGAHKARTTLHPDVDVTIAPLGTHRVPFELELTAAFESVELTLLNGAIVSIGAGTCSVETQLQCGGVDVPPKKHSPKVRLGRPYTLQPVVQVASPDA
jgi:hypothetical protein